ncbi:hypothetical protein J0H58_14685 [bacterium]|nr:hypothetical protein [bacterium]
MSQQTLSVKLLFPTEEACRACLPGVNVAAKFQVPIADGVTLQGKPAIQAAGLAATELLIQAAITISTSVTVKVLGEMLSNWLNKSTQTPKISIGSIVVASGDPADIQKAITAALQPPAASEGTPKT